MSANTGLPPLLLRLGARSCYWREIESGSPRRTRREQLEWQIREREKRLADVRARLAAIRAETR